MRLCIITPNHGRLDEGLKNTANHLTQVLALSHDMLVLESPKSFISLKGWLDLKHFRPDIVHIYLPCTFYSLIFTKIISCYYRKVKIVFSACQPPWNVAMISFFRKFLKPDVVLIQCRNTNTIFSSLGFKTRFLSSGVNTKKFNPVAPDRKRELREKYSIDIRKYVIMHVGPILRQRNIKILKRLQRDPENQVIIIGSTSINPDVKLMKDLTDSGCIVWVKYFEYLEEIYQLADVFVFPTTNQSHSAIDQPLTVLEAMSCNIPVISTPFGGLPEVLKEEDGIYFFSNEEELVYKVKEIKTEITKTNTMNKVSHLSWDNVAKELEGIYNDL